MVRNDLKLRKVSLERLLGVVTWLSSQLEIIVSAPQRAYCQM